MYNKRFLSNCCAAEPSVRVACINYGLAPAVAAMLVNSTSTTLRSAALRQGSVQDVNQNIVDHPALLDVVLGAGDFPRHKTSILAGDEIPSSGGLQLWLHAGFVDDQIANPKKRVRYLAMRLHTNLAKLRHPGPLGCWKICEHVRYTHRNMADGQANFTSAGEFRFGSVK